MTDHGSPFEFEFFFITGVMRSGTTLLQRVISTMPEANPPCVEFELPRIIVDRHVFSHGVTPETRQASREALIEAVNNFWVDQGRPKRLVGKDPLILRYSTVLLRLLPETKLIVSLRDPFYIIRSVLRVRDRQREDRIRSFLTDMNDCQVVDYVMYELSFVPPLALRPDVVGVRYEDMVRSNARLHQRLNAYLGAPVRFTDLPVTHEDEEKSPFATSLNGQAISDEHMQERAKLPRKAEEHVYKHYNFVLSMLGYPGLPERMPAKDALCYNATWARMLAQAS